MNEQILIVEDETDVAEILRFNLEKKGYRTIVAQSGEEALEAVQIHTPDLVLLDIMLPELNGWEVCRILRESAKGKSISIIMLSALTDEEARVKGLSLGADDYLTKPFSVRELLLKVRKCIDRQQALRRLRTREREQDTSMQYLVHELKNAVSIIGGYSTLALRRKDPETFLRTINTAAAHAENLLNDASLLTRLEREGGAFPLEPVDIGEIATDVGDMFGGMAAKKRVEIMFMNTVAGRVRGNRTALRQVLVNLVSNAVKYNRDGGKVWLRFDEGNGWTELSVTDEGSGVHPDEVSRIFGKFYRASGSERQKGAGLGLYIAKLLTEAMGGNITVASSPGAGSTFTLSLQTMNAASPDAQEYSEHLVAQAADREG